MQNMGDLSDEELLAGLQASIGEERRWVARVVAYLAEIERRKLHLESACSSLFDFCRRRLGMSDGEAFRRMTAARLVQRFPIILDRLDRGDVHLSALVLLRDHLTDDNHVELLREASDKTKREVEELIAARFPKPDVPSRIEKLAHAPAQGAPQARLALGGSAAAPQSTTPIEPRAHVEPLSAARYRVELTASRELRDKLERAQDLMRHRNPSGDLAVILEQALDLLIAKLEKQRLGKTTRPPEQKNNERADEKKTAEDRVDEKKTAEDRIDEKKTAEDRVDEKKTAEDRAEEKKTAGRPGYIPRHVRRAVYARDGEQCTFVSDDGHRCPARAFLELDHRLSKALGGSDDVDNLRVCCRAHNQLHAEHVFGREHVRRRIQLRQRKRQADSAPAFETAARGLKSLGFRESEVQRALAMVRTKLGFSVASTEVIIREALAVAT